MLVKFYREVSKRLMVGCLCILSTSFAWGLPLLQLDISGGSYVGGTDETIYANSSTFTLFALYSGSTAPSGTFYISAAIQPKQPLQPTQPNFGSFTINNTTYSSGLSHGVPPLAVIDDAPKVQDLGVHEIYPTYYVELAFNFGNLQAMPYNSALTPGGLQPGSGMYYYEFDVDVSQLLSTYSLHFDLYNQIVKDVSTGKAPATAITLGSFAPYSHDAHSGPGGGGKTTRHQFKTLPRPSSCSAWSCSRWNAAAELWPGSEAQASQASLRSLVLFIPSYLSSTSALAKGGAERLG